MSTQTMTTPTRARWPVVAAAAGLVAVAALTWFMRPAERIDARPGSGAGATAPSLGGVEKAEPRSSVAAPTLKPAATRAVADTRQMEDFVAQWTTCERSDEACQDTPLAASSYEEAMWLSRHGYPTAQQLADYDITTTDSLRAAAAAGDLASRALYGRRLIEDGDYYGGTFQLKDAADAGGYYALYELSDVYGTPGDHYVPPESFAYLRVAYLLGDAKAARFLAQILAERGGADIVEMQIIDDRAAELRKNAYGTTPAVPRP